MRADNSWAPAAPTASISMRKHSFLSSSAYYGWWPDTPYIMPMLPGTPAGAYSLPLGRKVKNWSWEGQENKAWPSQSQSPEEKAESTRFLGKAQEGSSRVPRQQA